MDPRIALYDWLNRNSTAGGDYSEWVARGGFPAVVELAADTKRWKNGDKFATVISVSGNQAHVVFNTSGKVRWIARKDIFRVTLT